MLLDNLPITGVFSKSATPNAATLKPYFCRIILLPSSQGRAITNRPGPHQETAASPATVPPNAPMLRFVRCVVIPSFRMTRTIGNRAAGIRGAHAPRVPCRAPRAAHRAFTGVAMALGIQCIPRGAAYGTRGACAPPMRAVLLSVRLFPRDGISQLGNLSGIDQVDLALAVLDKEFSTARQKPALKPVLHLDSAAAESQRPGTIPAQGNALGKMSYKDKALKGRAKGGPPFQGFAYIFYETPRRCLRLVWFAPSALGGCICPSAEQALLVMVNIHLSAVTHRGSVSPATPRPRWHQASLSRSHRQ